MVNIKVTKGQYKMILLALHKAGNSYDNDAFEQSNQRGTDAQHIEMLKSKSEAMHHLHDILKGD